MGYQSYSNQVYFFKKVVKMVKFHNEGAPGSIMADLPLVMVFDEGQNILQLVCKNNILQSQTFLSGWNSVYQKMTLVNANRLVFYNCHF